MPLKCISGESTKSLVGVKIKTLRLTGFILVIFVSAFITASRLQRLQIAMSLNSIKIRHMAKNTKWAELLLQVGYSICVDKQDRLYVTDGTHNRVLLFDADGNLVKAIGQRGLGPGDFDMPRIISCFNNALIAVCENPMVHMVSIHKTDGAFIRKFHTQYAPFSAWLSGDNLLVYPTSGLIGKTNLKFLYKLFSENDQRGDLLGTYERQTSMFFYDDMTHMPWSTSFKSNLYGELRVSGNQRGEILVGMTDESDFELYKPGLKSKRKVHLEMPKLDQVRPYVEKLKAQILKEKEEILFKEKHLINKFGKLEFSPDHLPYYRRFLLDDYGRIYVFLNDYLVRGKKQKINVYATTGKLLQEIELDLTGFELYLDSSSFLQVEPVAVSERYIYFMLPTMNDDGDLQSRVYRSALKTD